MGLLLYLYVIKIPWLKIVYFISSDHETQEGLGAKTDRLIAIL
jgi:hypothetical protein